MGTSNQFHWRAINGLTLLQGSHGMCWLVTQGCHARVFPHFFFFSKQWLLWKRDFGCLNVCCVKKGESWPGVWFPTIDLLLFRWLAWFVIAKTELLSVWLNTVKWLICCPAFPFFEGEEMFLVIYESLSVFVVLMRRKTLSLRLNFHVHVVWSAFLFMPHFFRHLMWSTAKSSSVWWGGHLGKCSLL